MGTVMGNENKDNPPHCTRLWFKSIRVRRNAIWIAVIVGGALQYEYTTIKHPATPLVILEALYGLIVIIAVVWLLASVFIGHRR
jgi:hypothetical protein